MFVIVGLGNIGDRFNITRHNAGFLLLDFLARELCGNNAEFKMVKKFEAEVFKCSGFSSIFGNEVLFVKPQTYMNESGRAVRKVLDFYKLEASRMLLIHDDLDLEFGHFKIQQKGPRVHNGVNSVEKTLGVSDFWRIRFGIAGEHYELIKKQGGTMKEDYVLKDFSKAEQERLPGIYREIWERLPIVLG